MASQLKKAWTERERETFKGLCGIMATRAEVCAVMGVSEKTLNALVDENFHCDVAPEQKKPITFQDAFAYYSAEGKMSIRRKQFELALDGDKTMLIWLGKQYLDQKEPDKRVAAGANTGTQEARAKPPIEIILGNHNAGKSGDRMPAAN